MSNPREKLEKILGKKIEKILVCRLSAIGDAVRTVPSVAALRKVFPDCEIHWLIEDRCADILLNLEYVDKFKIVPRRKWKKLGVLGKVKAYFEFVDKELKAENYDIYIDFHGILKSGLYGFFAKIPARIGYSKPIAKELNTFFTNFKVRGESAHISRYERNFLIPLYFDKTLNQTQPKLPVEPEQREFVSKWLRENKVNEKEFFFIYPGTSAKGRYKRWMPERYGKLAAMLYEKYKLPSVVGWGPGEEEIVEKVISRSKGKALKIPLTTMKQLAAFIEKAYMFIGGDTGPMHISSMVGTPVVTIFGPSDPVINKPAEFTPFKIVYANWHCSPCRNKKCKTLDCLLAINEVEVLKAVEDLANALRERN